MGAELLDERRFSDWIEFIADDFLYHLPVRRNVKFGAQHRANSDPEWDISWLDEGKDTLTGTDWIQGRRYSCCHWTNSLVRLTNRSRSGGASLELSSDKAPPSFRCFKQS